MTGTCMAYVQLTPQTKAIFVKHAPRLSHLKYKKLDAYLYNILDIFYSYRVLVLV